METWECLYDSWNTCISSIYLCKWTQRRLSFLFWQCFLFSLDHQVHLIVNISIFKVQKQILGAILGVSLLSKSVSLYLEFDLGKLPKTLSVGPVLKTWTRTPVFPIGIRGVNSCIWFLILISCCSGVHILESSRWWLCLSLVQSWLLWAFGQCISEWTIPLFLSVCLS